MVQMGEKAVDGITAGLINLDETVTWQAKHFFKNRTFKTRITAMKLYSFFEDTMEEGDFKSVRHEHHFKPIVNGTIMIDLFHFETPYGKFGSFINAVVLKRYLRKLLENRNNIIKQFAEGEKWKLLLKHSTAATVPAY